MNNKFRLQNLFSARSFDGEILCRYCGGLLKPRTL